MSESNVESVNTMNFLPNAYGKMILYRMIIIIKLFIFCTEMATFPLMQMPHSLPPSAILL